MSTFIEQIEKIIRLNGRYSAPRLGQVIRLDDPLRKGRIMASVPFLGADTEDKGVWVYPAQNSALVTPAVGDWIIIMWLDNRGNGGGDIRPFYVGRALWMADQIPVNYVDENSQILFEAKNNSMHITYDESSQKMEIGNQGFQPAARQEDPIISDNTLDSTFFTWVATVSAVLNSLVPGSVPVIPSSFIGKINGGSNQVEIGDK